MASPDVGSPRPSPSRDVESEYEQALTSYIEQYHSDPPQLFDFGAYNRKRRDQGVDGPSLASKGVQRYVMAFMK
eukprot:7167724-Alexandrium_andersonii.AAC.1